MAKQVGLGDLGLEDLVFSPDELGGGAPADGAQTGMDPMADADAPDLISGSLSGDMPTMAFEAPITGGPSAGAPAAAAAPDDPWHDDLVPDEPPRQQPAYPAHVPTEAGGATVPASAPGGQSMPDMALGAYMEELRLAIADTGRRELGGKTVEDTVEVTPAALLSLAVAASNAIRDVSDRLDSAEMEIGELRRAQEQEPTPATTSPAVDVEYAAPDDLIPEAPQTGADGPATETPPAPRTARAAKRMPPAALGAITAAAVAAAAVAAASLATGTPLTDLIAGIAGSLG